MSLKKPSPPGAPPSKQASISPAKKVATKGSLFCRKSPSQKQPSNQKLAVAKGPKTMPWRPHQRHQPPAKAGLKRPTPAKAPPQPLTKAPAKASSSGSAPAKAPQSIKKAANKTLLHHQKLPTVKGGIKKPQTVGGFTSKKIYCTFQSHTVTPCKAGCYPIQSS